MNLHHPIGETITLAVVVLACWFGVIGMLRMKEPTQALHYLSLPAVGAIALTIAVFLETGPTQAAWKTASIMVMLLAVNSVVTHASARAFRTRELGHWEPLNGDPIEFVRDTNELEQ
jgi:multisubunit Na+/H+ antiporter MnhG subunit